METVSYTHLLGTNLDKLFQIDELVDIATGLKILPPENLVLVLLLGVQDQLLKLVRRGTDDSV